MLAGVPDASFCSIARTHSGALGSCLKCGETHALAPRSEEESCIQYWSSTHAPTPRSWRSCVSRSTGCPTTIRCPSRPGCGSAIRRRRSTCACCRANRRPSGTCIAMVDGCRRQRRAGRDGDRGGGITERAATKSNIRSHALESRILCCPSRYSDLWGCVVSTGPGYRGTRAEDAAQASLIRQQNEVPGNRQSTLALAA